MLFLLIHQNDLLNKTKKKTREKETKSLYLIITSFVNKHVKEIWRKIAKINIKNVTLDIFTLNDCIFLVFLSMYTLIKKKEN